MSEHEEPLILQLLMRVDGKLDAFILRQDAKDQEQDNRIGSVGLFSYDWVRVTTP
jgi:hypothetical protein